jgi:hypothetical protein
MNQNDTRLVCRILRFISENDVMPAITDNVAYCLADSNVNYACQYLWGAFPPNGVEVNDKWEYKAVILK